MVPLFTAFHAVNNNIIPNGDITMAKIHYPATVAGITGSIGNGVYYRSVSTRFGYIRNWVMPTLTPNNALRGSIMKNLADIWKDASELYKADFKAYAAKARLLPIYGNDTSVRANNGFAYFVMAMQGWSDIATPNVSLATITLEDITSAPAPLVTVSGAVIADLIPAVTGYEAYTEEIG